MARKTTKRPAAPQELSEAEAATVVGGVNYFQGRVLTDADFNAAQSTGGAALVEFKAGDASSPVVIGSLWNDADKPPS